MVRTASPGKLRKERPRSRRDATQQPRCSHRREPLHPTKELLHNRPSREACRDSSQVFSPPAAPTAMGGWKLRLRWIQEEPCTMNRRRSRPACWPWPHGAVLGLEPTSPAQTRITHQPSSWPRAGDGPAQPRGGACGVAPPPPPPPRPPPVATPSARPRPPPPPPPPLSATAPHKLETTAPAPIWVVSSQGKLPRRRRARQGAR
jgi:hypothetical protein